MLAQEPGQGLGSLPADIEYGDIGDTGEHGEPPDRIERDLGRPVLTRGSPSV